jgi:hypothetical protein
MKMNFFNEICLNIQLPSNNIDVSMFTFSSPHLLSSFSPLSLQIPIIIAILKMVMAQRATIFLLVKNHQKLTLPKVFGENPFFS